MSNMAYVTPPDEKSIPPHLSKDNYIAGYMHGWKSNKLTDLSLSFREGFRRAKFEVQSYWKSQGVTSINKGKKGFKIVSL